MKRLGALALLCVVTACAHPSPQPSPTASPAPTASPTPSAAPTVAPSAAGSTAPSPTASPAPATPLPYNYIYTPAPAAALAATPDPSAPRILEIDLNERILDAPGPIRVRILTNASVTSVIARTMGRELGVPQEGPGVFGADDEIPSIPFFLRNRTYNVEIVAAVADGRTTSVTIPIILR